MKSTGAMLVTYFCIRWNNFLFQDQRYMNWRDVQRNNVVDMTSLRASWQNGQHKNKHTEHYKNTKHTKTQHIIRKKYFYLFLIIFKWYLKCSTDQWWPAWPSLCPWRRWRPWRTRGWRRRCCGSRILAAWRTWPRSAKYTSLAMVWMIQ